ncbi:MAG TPA: phosphatase PAP2 family protein [Burkholderiaceae bacterium]|nr:phosphatase PAP2 family protein [Burkholderiaceae bacterium]
MNTESSAAAAHATPRWPDQRRAPRWPQPLRLDLAVALLSLLALVAWEVGGLDLAVSRHYGTIHGFLWRDAWLTRALLHDGGRALGWCVLAVMVGTALWRTEDPARRRQHGYWIGITLLCVALIPTIKRFSASSCPWDLAEFGGIAAYVPHWRLGVRDGGPGHCFPSGHAVAAFAFLTLYFDWRALRPRLARGCLAAVCIAGVLYGWAQLARGAHYVSHTLWSAWLCWVVCAAAAWWRTRGAGASELGRPGSVGVQRDSVVSPR